MPESRATGQRDVKAPRRVVRDMQETMKAAVLVGPEKIEVKEVPLPKPGPGMILIRVSACGVCGSDVHMWKAGAGWSDEPIPDFRMGHEFCGVVVDPATASSPGATA